MLLVAVGLLAAAMLAVWMGKALKEPDAEAAVLSVPAASPAESHVSGPDALPRESAGALATRGAVAALLSQKHDMTNPSVRAALVRQVRALEDAGMAQVMEKARRLGLPLEGDRPGGGRFVLAAFEGDLPVYERTENANAAISTATNLVRSTSPFHVDGTGMIMGLWEAGGIPRVTHQEFGSPTRITIMDGSTTASTHATHVAGTLIATGVVASVRGMAPGARLRAYSSTSDTSEMLAEGAASAGEAGRITLSNHSYGFDRGWENDGGTWVWLGTFTDDSNPANDVDQRFGRYDANSAAWDGMTANVPYYLPFISAGNHRSDGPPAAGATWRQGSVTGTARTYDPAQHPAGDGTYKGGYDTCEGKKLAKNVMTVGATLDAVSGGVRSLAVATLAAFSSIGPVDDGRIKPDVVANGSTLTSASNDSDTSTASTSGTSMATPNASGSALLLQQYYVARFPGGGMRASTLKALIIHTADDIGNPGPDYRHGWGMMNTLAAASLIKKHADGTGDGALVEDEVTSTVTSRTHVFASNGTGPLRFTLCWTDPAGTAKTSGHDVRTRDLVNDLNLTVTGPAGSTHLPYVMPHVGDWSLASLSANATTGVNTVDNVEQVHLSVPPAAGVYTVTVNFAGSLAGGAQKYSLVASGQSPLPEIVVEQPAGTSLVDGGSVGVPDVAVGAASDLSFTVKNIGTADLTGIGATLSGTDAAMFSVLQPPAASLAGPSGSTTLVVRFVPTSTGTKTATLRISSNDADENPFDITLSGAGLAGIGSWRQAYFGTSAGTGHAADGFDFDSDGLANLIEFAFGLNPVRGASSQLPQAQLSGGMSWSVFQPRQE